MNKRSFTKVWIEGRPHWVSQDAKWIRPVISGGDGEEGEGEGGDEGDKPTVSQKQLNEIVSARVNKAKESAVKDLLKSIGVDDPEALKTIIAKAKEAEEQGKSDLQKAQDEAARHKTQAETTSQSFTEYQINTEIQFALIEAGLKPAEAKRAAKLVEVDSLDQEKIKAAVEDLKKDMPQLFSGTGVPNVQGGNPGTPPPGSGNNNGNDPSAVARQMLHERHPQLKKS